MSHHASRAEMSWVPAKRLWKKQIKDPSGKYVSVYGPTKQAVREKVAEKRAAWAAAIASVESPEFASVAVRWASLTASDVSRRVLAYRQSALSNHILPVLGEISAEQLRQEDVLRFKASISSMSRDSQTKLLAPKGGIE